MADSEVLAIAVIRPHEGKEVECVSLLRQLYGVLTAKAYSRDVLYRDARNPALLFNLRYWRSEEARSHAHEDPDVHRYWAQLGQVCTVETVYEHLEPIAE